MIKVVVEYSYTVDVDSRSVNSCESEHSEDIVHNDVYDDLRQEVQVIRTLYHDHIVLFYHEIDMKGVYGYVMEYCKHGTLHDYILKKGPMPEAKIQIVMRQMLLALNYLASHRIVHR